MNTIKTFEENVFGELRVWCEKHNAVIYAGEDGNVWITVRNAHYRGLMLSKDFDTWQPFEQVNYTKIDKI